MDINLIMAIITISAIFSPVIVSIVDNVFKFYYKKFELKYPNQRKILNEFVDNAMKYYIADNFNMTTNYITSKNNLYIYFNNVKDDYFRLLEIYSENKNLDDYKNTINIIVKDLSQQIGK